MACRPRHGTDGWPAPPTPKLRSTPSFARNEKTFPGEGWWRRRELKAVRFRAVRRSCVNVAVREGHLVQITDQHAPKRIFSVPSCPVEERGRGSRTLCARRELDGSGLRKILIKKAFLLNQPSALFVPVRVEVLYDSRGDTPSSRDQEK
jgi:hypothetical protein